MARKETFAKEEIMNKSVNFIKENGIENFNVRSLSKYIGCSTQPLFRHFESIEELKKDLKLYLHKDYENFIEKYIDKEDYLYTISYAYALYAKKHSNSFKALFITDLAGTRTVKEVVTAPHNIDTIKAMTKQYNIPLKKAEDVYRDVRFYTHGIASQLVIKSIKLRDNDISKLIKNNIDINLGRN